MKTTHPNHSSRVATFHLKLLILLNFNKPCSWFHFSSRARTSGPSRYNSLAVFFIKCVAIRHQANRLPESA